MGGAGGRAGAVRWRARGGAGRELPAGAESWLYSGAVRGPRWQPLDRLRRVWFGAFEGGQVHAFLGSRRLVEQPDTVFAGGSGWGALDWQRRRPDPIPGWEIQQFHGEERPRGQLRQGPL